MVSVIIVNYQSALLTKRAVDSVLSDGEPAEVLVVDNTATGEERGTLEKLLPPVTRLIFNDTNEGFAKACNRAFAESRGKWIFLLNPDAYLLPGALRTLRKFLVDNPAVGAAAPRTYWDDERTFLLPPSIFPSPYDELRIQLGRLSGNFRSLASRLNRWRSIKAWNSSSPVRQKALSGGNVMIRRSAVEKCGGLFDDIFFMYYEDSDLMLRLEKAGYALFLVPGAEAVHNYAHSGDKIDLMIQSKRLYFQKHFRRSAVLKISEEISVRTTDKVSAGSTPPGSGREPIRVSIPDQFQRRWLFEWSPSVTLIPSVGRFGSGPVLEFPADLWELLGPGTYYSRISDPEKILSRGICWSWVKE